MAFIAMNVLDGTLKTKTSIGVGWAGVGPIQVAHERGKGDGLGLVAGRARAEKDLGLAIGSGWLQPGFLFFFCFANSYSCLKQNKRINNFKIFL